jgi:hypothetical protein
MPTTFAYCVPRGPANAPFAELIKMYRAIGP